jgi:hypothetical protein
MLQNMGHAQASNCAGYSVVGKTSQTTSKMTESQPVLFAPPNTNSPPLAEANPCMARAEGGLLPPLGKIKDHHKSCGSKR